MELYDARTSYLECPQGVTTWGYGQLTLQQHKDAIVKFTRPVRKDSTNTGVEVAFRSMYTDYGDNQVAVCCEKPQWEAQTIEITFDNNHHPTEEAAWIACSVQKGQIRIAFSIDHLIDDDPLCTSRLKCQNYFCHVLYAAFAIFKHENECAIVIESSQLQTNRKIFLTSLKPLPHGKTIQQYETAEHAPIKLLHIQAAVACIQVAQMPGGTEIPEACEP